MNSAASARGDEAAIELPPVLLQMSRNQAVWDEWQLSSQQITQLETLLRPLDAQWWPARIQPADKRLATTKRLTAQLRQALRSMCDDDQWNRVEQLKRQALGTRMVFLKEVATALELTAEQLQDFRAVAAATDQAVAELNRQQQSGEKVADAAEKLQAIQDQERQDIVGGLTVAQQAKLGPLLGQAFDFSQVKRTHPHAPDLLLTDSTWLQHPLSGKWDDLKGKVVAVHFYAFQCINCKRNLPHYAAWHQDLADQGLVVIGVQSPETSAERDAKKVAAAAKAEGIEYPVLMDTSSENWRAWGTTMWPTVYLIDKQGYIRTWWQGEMNWQGTPGEQRMRDTIKTLLAE
ncbi:redoxin domain-containing protein [Roseimaritima ulvae]|uniref:redoxin domain-containing protein n=1 Tax=Roseimaritima ulvae TaxID=980254 RepID=UPI00138FDB45|nr:redoxin domain-containing protein [Roseimaritima ulvae]